MTDQNKLLPTNQNVAWPDPPWSIPPYVFQTQQPIPLPPSMSTSRFQNTPSWVFKDSSNNPATVDIDFANNLAFLYNGAGQGLVTSPANLLITTRASAETYTDTGGNITYVNSNIAALGNNGLQVWEARTNQQTFSAVNTAGWSVGDTTLVGASAVSPDGTSNAGTITDNAVSGLHNIFQQSQAVTGSQTQTSSIFLKQGSLRYAQWLTYDTSGNGVLVFVDTQLGVLSGGTTLGAGATYVSSSIQAYVGGWWRVSLVGTHTADTNLIQDLRMSPDGSTTSYVGTGSTVFAWGAQLEQATFAGPYIPTTSGTAARAAASIKLTTPPVFGSAYSAVVWATPSSPVANAVFQDFLNINDGTGTNRFAFERNSVNGLAQMRNISGGTSGALDSTAAWAQSVFGKEAASTIAGLQVQTFNGVVASGSSTGAIPIGVNTVQIGSSSGGGSNFTNGNLSRIAIWPTLALSSADLQRITT